MGIRFSVCGDLNLRLIELVCSMVMDMEAVGDLEFVLDLEMLQLPEVSYFALKSNPCVVEALFSQWLSLPETGRLVFIQFILILLFL